MSYFKERFNKRFFKNAFKLVVFVLVIFSILFALSPVFSPKTNKSLRDKSANGILGEPENSIDVLIIGDSESYSTFIPLQMWNEYGISSYVCGTPSQTLAYSKDFLRRAFKTQKPKLVVLEANNFFRKFSLGDAVLIRADEWFPIYRYHDRWKKLTLADFSSKFTADYVENNKGFHLYTGVKPVPKKDYMKKSDEKEKLPYINRAYINRMYELCKENGAELMIVSAPNYKNWSTKRYNTVSELAGEMGVEYLDMNMLRKEVPIDWSCETRDGGDHLNYAGAKKTTAYFGEYLNSKNILTDHRGEEVYSDWNKAYKNFLKEVEKVKAQDKKEETKEKSKKG